MLEGWRQAGIPLCKGRVQILIDINNTTGPLVQNGWRYPKVPCRKLEEGGTEELAQHEEQQLLKANAALT